jgi:hypothetical protein
VALGVREVLLNGSKCKRSACGDMVTCVHKCRSFTNWLQIYMSCISMYILI